MTEKGTTAGNKRKRGITEPLQYKIDLIGRLVRQVVHQQADSATTRLIEDLMDHCETAAKSDQWRSHTDLQPRIEALKLDQLVWVCRAFTFFFTSSTRPNVRRSPASTAWHRKRSRQIARARGQFSKRFIISSGRASPDTTCSCWLTNWISNRPSLPIPPRYKL